MEIIFIEVCILISLLMIVVMDKLFGERIDPILMPILNPIFDKIEFLIFHFILFLRLLFMGFLWLIHFGTEYFYLYWTWDDELYVINFYPIIRKD